MAWAIVLQRNSDDGLLLAWSARWTLTARILAVNIFALAMLAGGFVYLDTYRTRLIDQRAGAAARETRMLAAAIAATPPSQLARLSNTMERITVARIRLYDRQGNRIIDSWQTGHPSFALVDPLSEPWERKAARLLDRIVDHIVDAPPLEYYREPQVDDASAWPELQTARRDRSIATLIRYAPDRTVMLSAAVLIPDRSGHILLTTSNARDVTSIVRAERYRLGIVLLIVVLLSVLLSLFLARTIVRPLRRLALAAHRVRLGRAREVQVPRLPSRRDEIGTLARALSDMSLALRQRIDATETFAADVAHELKNPLASLRSAVDSLGLVRDPALQAQLLAVIHDDVARLDRLITDIAEASRVDAELARARFETVDLGVMIEGLVKSRERRGQNRGVRLAFARPHKGTAIVFGDGSRLTRVIENLIDNAISFSPTDGLVQIAATRDDEHILIRVEDEGPGVPIEARDAIFNRFHSVRPDSEQFGRHSGLGLAIAKAIVEGHGGTIHVTGRDNDSSGARFVIRLPAARR